MSNNSNNSNNNLSLYIRRFFMALTPNKPVVDLAVEIQKSLELGHTCIEYKDEIDDSLISHDGKSGYIVVNDGKAGFRRFYQQESYIRDEFINPKRIVVDFLQLKAALVKIKAISIVDETETIDKQWQASLAFLLHHRFILSGGPGTGKTTTVIRMILLYKSLYPEKVIALAAPTGKAANRLVQSLQTNTVLLQELNNSQDSFPKQATTLHRLLGYNPQKNTLKYNRINPLPHDLIIIDEASMLDISMMHALLRALKNTAQLVLIGDKNQLPAVDAGNVFEDLCGLNKEDNESLNLVKLIENNKNINELNVSNTIQLNKNYRFIQNSIVAKLAEAMINEDFIAFKSYRNSEDFNWSHPLTKESKTQKLKQWYQSLPNNETALLLSPTNFGNNSVDELNQLAKQLLHQNKQKNENMPIMVTKNDYTLNIFNGDIGYMHWQENIWQVAFEIEGKTQYIQLDAIHQWQPAHAISIHKSQGSEYQHILIAIPDFMEHEILTNKLLYTAITRAKHSITLWASEEIINKIMATNAKRMTFLN